MKVQREEPKVKFVPVTLTLETQEELDYLCSLVGSVHGEGKVRKFVDSVYIEIRPHTKSLNYFPDSIRCKTL